MLAAVAVYFVVDLWRARTALVEARAALGDLQGAVEARDERSAETAVQRLEAASARAADHTDGPIWAVAEWLPLVGDDVEGVRSMSRSLHTVAADGLDPLVSVMMRVDRVTVDGRVDVPLVRGLQQPLGSAHDAFDRGAGLVAGLDSSGFVGAFQRDFRQYVEFVTAAERALSSGATAADLVPGMVGAQGPRDYLLVFQTNAEIRATGGMPGSWARVHAEGGVLTMMEQGSAASFGERPAPVLPLSAAERAVYGPQLGTYFQDATFTPDFPRAAELMAARWEERYPAVELDGVISVDTVALSYLLEGIGPVPVSTVTLTRDNAARVLLSDIYTDVAPSDQDAAFESAARAIFEAAQGDLASPGRFLAALDRAAAEGRFRVASFDEDESSALVGSRVAGAIPDEDGTTPHVDVTVNDATGSKMSYYLRYATTVKATDCGSGGQAVLGRMTLRQTLATADAARLPDYVTGGGRYGIEPGTQLLLVRLFAPAGGEVMRLEVAGRSVMDRLVLVPLAGREVATVAVQVGDRPVEVEWLMRTAAAQSGDVVVRVTPGMTGGDHVWSAPSAC